MLSIHPVARVGTTSPNCSHKVIPELPSHVCVWPHQFSPLRIFQPTHAG